MPIQIEEPVKASLVIANVAYLGQSVTNLLTSFDQKTTGNILVSQPNESGQHFKAALDRITIYQQPNRVMIEKESPSGFDDFVQLADVAEMAIANINVHLENLAQGISVDSTPPEDRVYTFGFNMELGCRYHVTSKPGEVVSGEVAIARFLNVEELKTVDCTNVSGGLELEFTTNDYVWRLSLKPFPGFQDGSLLLAALNRHSENRPLPRTRDEIKEAFQTVWTATETMINMLEIPR